MTIFGNDINDINVFVKFKFLNWNKDTLLDPDLVNDIPKPPKPLGDEIVKITKLSIKMRTKRTELIENKSVVLSGVYLLATLELNDNEMKLLEKDAKHILSKRPIDTAMPPPITITITKRLISSKRQCNAPFWGYLYPFCSNTNVELFVNIFVNNFVNKPPLRPWQ